MEMQIVNVYKRKGCILMHPYSRTVVGAWVSQQPGLGVDHDATADVIGQCILMCRVHSCDGLDELAWKNKPFELLHLSGVKGERGFSMGVSAQVRVQFTEESVLIRKYELRGETVRLSDNCEAESLPADVSPAELGETVCRLLLSAGETDYD